MALVLERTQGGVVLGEPPIYVDHPRLRINFSADELEEMYWSTGNPDDRGWKEDNAKNFYRAFNPLKRILDVMHEVGAGQLAVGTLSLAKIHGDTGRVEDFGLVSCAVVTDVGCQKIVAVMNTSDAATGIAFKFHGLGTGSVAEAAGDTALGTELTTQYNPDNTRATGTQTTGSTTKVYRTVATNTLDSGTPAVTEHGVLSASSGGSLLDRSVFSAINLNGANGDGIQSTYDFALTSGG